MSSFVVKENWGRPQNNKKKDYRIERQGRTETEFIGTHGSTRRSWLSGRKAESEHHEPPQYELKARGYQAQERGKAKISLTLAEHALFHFVRGQILKSQVDFDTAISITCRMTERQNAEYEEIVSDTRIMTIVEEEILRRQRIWLSEC